MLGVDNAMPSEPENPSIRITGSGTSPFSPPGNRPSLPAIPSFAALPREAVWRRLRSNLAACLTAAPRGVLPWQFAPMFRSAYFRKTFPTRPLLESALLHVIVLTAWISEPPQTKPQRIAAEVEVARAERRIIWYNPIDPLPPISPLEPEKPARREPPRARASGRLAFHPVERMISRPPQPESSRQTILQPEAPQLRLPADVPIPNIVAWMPPVVPPPPSLAETQKQLAQIRVPRMPVPIVAAPTPIPPKLTLPEMSVPAAPVSELPKAPVPPSPSVAETQKQLAQIRVPRMPVPTVSAPMPLPPVVMPTAETAALPTLVAVGIAPAPPPPRVEVRLPLGNRSGEFAVSPEGEERTASLAGPPGRNSTAREAAPPLPNVGELADIRVPHLSISGDRTSAVEGPVASPPPEPRAAAPPPPVPSPPSPPARDLRALLARAARPALLPDGPRHSGNGAEPEFFGARQVYTVYINMPNLTSGAGSWILRFAEREGEGREAGEISSPVADKKVDPKYVPSAVRDRVEGTVTLAAQILRDGTVASVQVVRGLDPRLDLSAVQALTLWEFEPARKKGVPIDLEVLVQIPFRLPAL